MRRTIIVLLVLGAAVAAGVLEPVRLGLDLRGGTQVVLEARPVADRPLDDDTLDRTADVWMCWVWPSPPCNAPVTPAPSWSCPR
jgi:preprotein translocase subunit SecD